MSHYYQTAEKGNLTKHGFDYIDAEGLADLQAQVDEAGIAPTINTGDVVAYEMGDMIAVIVKASVFTEAAQKASAAGVAFK